MTVYIWSVSLNTLTGCMFRHIRDTIGKGQKDVAKEIGQLPSTISKLESGSANITIEHIYSFCTTYRISLSDFVELIEQATLKLQQEKVLIYIDRIEDVNIKKNSVELKRRLVGTRVVKNNSFFGILGRTHTEEIYEEYEDNENERQNEDELELPKLSSKQTYSILREYLKSLEITKKLEENIFKETLRNLWIHIDKKPKSDIVKFLENKGMEDIKKTAVLLAFLKLYSISTCAYESLLSLVAVSKGNKKIIENEIILFCKLDNHLFFADQDLKGLKDIVKKFTSNNPSSG